MAIGTWHIFLVKINSCKYYIFKVHSKASGRFGNFIISRNIYFENSKIEPTFLDFFGILTAVQNLIYSRNVNRNLQLT